MWSDAGPGQSPDSDHRPGNCCVSVTSPGCGLITQAGLAAPAPDWSVCAEQPPGQPAEKLDRFGLVAASSKENSYNFEALSTRCDFRERECFLAFVTQEVFIRNGGKA